MRFDCCGAYVLLSCMCRSWCAVFYLYLLFWWYWICHCGMSCLRFDYYLPWCFWALSIILPGLLGWRYPNWIGQYSLFCQGTCQCILSGITFLFLHGVDHQICWLSVCICVIYWSFYQRVVFDIARKSVGLVQVLLLGGFQWIWGNYKKLTFERILWSRHRVHVFHILGS